MKHFWKVVLIVSILFSTIIFVEWNIYRSAYQKNIAEANLILKDAYIFVSTENSNSTETNKTNDEYSETTEKSNNNDYTKMINENGVIGVLIIPSLNVKAPIKDGTSQEVMRTSVGHFTESDYWNGNVSLASHNSGTSAHYFEKISKLKANDEIEYVTKNGTKKYKVESVKTIESTDWSMVLKSDGSNTNSNKKVDENTITLITCITGKPNYRLCVRGIEEV